MNTYTEYYHKRGDSYLGVRDISASRYYYLSECLHCKTEKKRCNNKYSFMRHYNKSNIDYIVYNDTNQVEYVLYTA